MAWLPLFAFAGALFLAPPATLTAQEFTVRSLSGSVTDDRGAPVKGAAVKIKNLRTLQIRSYLTDAQGAYHFNGLSSDIDYEVQAAYRSLESATKMLSRFDSKREAVIDLKIEPD